MKLRLAGLSLIIGLSSIAVAIAEEVKPDFSGNWNLDREKSELGGGPRMVGGRPGEGGGERQRGGGNDRRGAGGERRGGDGGMFGSLTLEQSGDTLTVRRKMNFQGEERVQESRYTTDGKENINEGFRGNSIKSKTYWEGSMLITESKMDTPNGTRETKEVRTLSPDSKVMTVETAAKGGFGEGTRKMVYNKQE